MHSPSNPGGPNPEPPATNPLTSLLAQRRDFLRFLERRVPSPAQAEDILQNAYIRALEHTAELPTHESSTAWFFRVLRNAVIDFYRHRAVEDRALAEWVRELETDLPAPNPTSSPTASMDSIVCLCIRSVLPTMRPAYAEILERVDLDEEPLASFASAHGITLPNATVRVHRARKALRERLIQTCGTCSTHGCLDCTCGACDIVRA